jgi:beta-fructofuranosidase
VLGDELLAKADASVRMARRTSARPIYLCPPANWMNDPNGPIYHAGYYHLSISTTRTAITGNMHWDTWSRDWWVWEHRRRAYHRRAKGGACLSQSTVTKSGRLLFYTSIGKRAARHGQPCRGRRTIREEALANPLLSEKLHGETLIYECAIRLSFNTVNGRIWFAAGI